MTDDPAHIIPGTMATLALLAALTALSLVLLKARRDR
jgi:hypothetical protein